MNICEVLVGYYFIYEAADTFENMKNDTSLKNRLNKLFYQTSATYRVRQIYGNAHFDLVLEKKTKKKILLQQLITK